MNVRALPAPLAWQPLRTALVAGLVVLAVLWNVNELVILLGWGGSPGSDWENLSNLPANPYANEVFRWTPAAAWGWSSLVEPLGIGLWRALHVLALAALPVPVAVLALLSAPFWADVANGNLLVFALVLGWHALQGRRLAVAGFVVLAVLVPRPLMLPVLWVLLWRYVEARWILALAILAVVGSAAAAGLLDDLIARMLASSGEMSTVWNIGPSRILGPAWIPIGVTLAAWLTWKGRLGLASLAISPYVFLYYLLFGLLELRDLGDPHLRLHVSAAGTTFHRGRASRGQPSQLERMRPSREGVGHPDE